MPGKWSMLRVPKSTHARIMREVDRQNAAYHLGRSTLKLGHLDRIAVSTVIEMLLDELDAHRARAEKQRGRRKPQEEPSQEAGQEPGGLADCV
jgi:hypothetical protein